MAEELDTTQKSKGSAELIKHGQNEQDNAEGGSKKRKKIVVKRKPEVPDPPQGSPPPAPKKPQDKAASEGQKDKSPGTPNLDGNVHKEPAQNSLEKTGKFSSQKESGKDPSSDPKEKKPQEKPPTPGPRGVSTFPATPRPNAAAGRVGGKLVGPRRPRDEAGPNRSSGAGNRTAAAPPPSVTPVPSVPGGNAPPGGLPFRPRPHSVAGRVGGKPMGHPQGSGYPNRSGPGGFRQDRPPQQGSPRPRSPGPGRTNPPQGPGRPGGFTPRPGFNRSGPPRPGPGGMRPGQTPPIIEGKGPAKKSFKAKKPVYTRRDKELEMEEKLLQTKKKIAHTANPVPKCIDIMEVISVSELARKMNLKASDLIQKLMALGEMVTINQQIDADTATLLASEFGAEVRIISLYDETVIETSKDAEADLELRPPVVTVMGHVDHGKTKLLDAIRSTDVVSGEFGGITQHIGASTVETPKGRITFLDTPGHEAFTRMRARGAQVTDIVVLVVAADDGVMPQTIEAINHAKEAKVPIIVAVNKMDKPEANPDRVKSQLSELGLQPEDWGGQTMFVQLSALRKEGLDKLIEAILLQAEVLDLKANFNRSAEGKILESRIDHGRGTVATVMVQKGTLKIGDSFVAGIWPGKVRALFNDKGARVETASPAMPVEVLGFEGTPNAGDPLQVVEDEKVARGISSKRQELKRFEDAKNVKKITLDNLYDTISDGAIQELKVIIKADVQGSAEALRSSLEKLSTKEVRLNVIQALPGAINEGDVDLAVASNAILIGFNVRPIPKAKILADQEKIDIKKYNVIYKAVEEIQQAMEGLLKPDTKEEVIATVEVRNTFKTPKFGTIAGCYVLTGTVKRNALVHIIRDGIVIHSGKLASLRRFKEDVKEVAAGYECGIGFEEFDGIATNDQLEIFEIVEVARKLHE
ncbi:MAG: translation initiation factor IF-2 [Spirochaetaceae bacterium]|nr:translation initiation factor IF-2 [Spirochaetaceae bacterium]